jgi:hypothetical protein
MVWVDSFQSAQRWLSREQMNRFDQRILFAMNANDSSSLIDSPLAGRLGENRALIYRGDTGTLEKFRPFSPPPADWLRQLASPESKAPAVLSTVSGPGPEVTSKNDHPVAPKLAIAEKSNSNLGESSTVPENDKSFSKPDEILSDELPSIDEMNVQ